MRSRNEEFVYIRYKGLVMSTSIAFPVPAFPADDYHAQFALLIELGNFGRKNPNITSSDFPGECISAFEAILLHFNRHIESNEAVQEMDFIGVRPATMIELLAFRAAFLNIRGFPIVELASFWEHRSGVRCVGCLRHYRHEREIRLSCWARGWGTLCRFLAVRKEEPLAA